MRNIFLMTFSQNWMRFAGVKVKMLSGEKQPGEDFCWRTKVYYRIFMLLEKEKVISNDAILQTSLSAADFWNCSSGLCIPYNGIWVRMKSEGNNYSKQWCKATTAAVLKINSSITCVSSGKQYKSKSNFFLSFQLLAYAQTSVIW